MNDRPEQAGIAIREDVRGECKPFLSPPTQGTIKLHGREINVSSIIIAGINRKDKPDFVDAYIHKAKFKEGGDLTLGELIELQEQEYEFINNFCNENF